jgi:hypothetical protein
MWKSVSSLWCAVDQVVSQSVSKQFCGGANYWSIVFWLRVIYNPMQLTSTLSLIFDYLESTVLCVESRDC